MAENIVRPVEGQRIARPKTVETCTRWILRFPQRNSASINAAWRLSMPRLLTGWLPSFQDAQSTMDRIKAGQMDEVKREIKALDRRINQAT